MLLMIHRIREDEEGQTLVLGAVSMLVLALAVMTTISIGQAAYDKIRLQNTADAAAYSLAATQARAFNFFAYTNRAMIAHYNTALTMVAYLSYAIYLKNTIGRMATILQFIPPLTAVMNVIKRVIDMAVRILRIVVRITLPVVNVVNGAYFLFQMGMWGVMQTQLIQNSRVAYENDPDVITGVDLGNLNASSVMQGAIKVLNLYMVNKGIDYLSMLSLIPAYGANRNFDNVKSSNSPMSKNAAGQDKGNEGRLIMNEMINAGRHPWVAGSKNGIPLIGRRWRFVFEVPVIGGVRLIKGARTEHAPVTGMGPRQNSRHDMIFSVDQFLFRVSIPFYWWQVVYNSIVAADYKKGGEFEQIQITDKHCGRWNYPCKAARALARPLTSALSLIFRAIPALFNLKQKKYRWFGITPFMKFQPSPKWRQAFNQPQYMVLASKPDEKLNSMSDTVHRSYGLDNGVSGDRIDANKRGTDSTLDLEVDVTDSDSFISSMMPGFNALAVARAYYHRPGEWKEHPNLFNPFWAAKLDPVAHHAFLGEVPHLANFGDEIILH